MTTTTAQKAIQKRDETVLKALKKGLSYRKIQEIHNIPKSTAYDISVRHGVFSKNAL